MYKQLIKSTLIVSLFTFICRVFGLIRDLVLAQIFGATADLEAFIVAFKIPNFMRRLFAEGAFSQAFVPVLMEYKEKENPEQIQHFIGAIAGALAVGVLVFVLIGLLLAPWCIRLFAPGFLKKPEQFHLAVTLLRLNFPYLFLIAMTAFLAALLNSYKHFLVPAITPVLLNMALIVGSLYGIGYMSPAIKILSIAVLIGGILQLFLQILTLKSRNIRIQWRIDWQNKGVRKVKKLMLGALFGVSIVQMGSIVDTAFASFLPHGSIAWLYYAQRLMQFPLGIFGVAVATVILPQLSAAHASDSNEHFSKLLDWAIRSICLIGLPASVGLLCIAQPVVVVLFQYGRFGSQDVSMTAYTLMALSLGVLPAMLLKPLLSIFYARQKMNVPVRMALFALLINTGLNAVFIWPFKQVGLALATSIALWSNVLFLWRHLFIECCYKPGVGWVKFIVRLCSASMVLVAWLVWVAPARTALEHWGLGHRIVSLSWTIVSGMTIYFFVLVLLGIRLKDFIGVRYESV